MKKASLLVLVDWVKTGQPWISTRVFKIYKMCKQGNERSGSDKLKESEKVAAVELLMEEETAPGVSPQNRVHSPRLLKHLWTFCQKRKHDFVTQPSLEEDGGTGSLLTW